MLEQLMQMASNPRYGSCPGCGNRVNLTEDKECPNCGREDLVDYTKEKKEGKVL